MSMRCSAKLKHCANLMVMILTLVALGECYPKYQGQIYTYANRYMLENAHNICFSTTSDVVSYSRFFVPELLRLDLTRVIQMFMYNPKWFKQLYMVLLGS